jgi:hypothetical protein
MRLFPSPSERRAGNEGLRAELIFLVFRGGQLALSDKVSTAVYAAVSPHPKPYPRGTGQQEFQLIFTLKA